MDYLDQDMHSCVYDQSYWIEFSMGPSTLIYDHVIFPLPTLAVSAILWVVLPLLLLYFLSATTTL